MVAMRKAFIHAGFSDSWQHTNHTNHFFYPYTVFWVKTVN